jgi:iron complex outermembrane receptor protein
MLRRVAFSAASLLVLAAAASAHAAEPAGAPEATPDTEVSKVVITAAPYAVSLDTVTSSVNIVTRDQLDLAPPAGLGDMLNGQPGLRSTFYGPGASRPVIRGLSGPRVMLLENGVGQVDASSLSPDHAVATDPGEASRVEVLRGPSTLAYGGSGIGGSSTSSTTACPTRRRKAASKAVWPVRCRRSTRARRSTARPSSARARWCSRSTPTTARAATMTCRPRRSRPAWPSRTA